MLQATHGIAPAIVRSLLGTMVQPIVVNTAVKAAAYTASSLIRGAANVASRPSPRVVIVVPHRLSHASSGARHEDPGRRAGFTFGSKFNWRFSKRTEVPRQPAAISRRPPQQKQPAQVPVPVAQPQPTRMQRMMQLLADQDFGNALAKVIENSMDAYRRAARRRSKPRVVSNVPPVDHSDDIWGDAPQRKVDIHQPPQHHYPDLHAQEPHQSSTASRDSSGMSSGDGHTSWGTSWGTSWDTSGDSSSSGSSSSDSSGSSSWGTSGDTDSSDD